jgi:hypothetical protein
MRRYVSFLLLVPLLLLGCDSNDPEPPTSALEVQGTYVFTELRFVPDGSAIAPANVLTDRLNEDNTTFRLLADQRQALLNYEVVSGAQGFATGSFTLTPAAVTVTFDGSGAGIVDRLLLPSPITFQRVGDDLSATIRSTQNLTAYNAEAYGSGATSVPGQLRVVLERQ